MERPSTPSERSSKDWVNSLYKRLYKNLSLLISSSLSVSVLSFGTLALNARGLGASDFGVLALIQAFTGLISAIVSFETWQPVIRHGAKHLDGSGKEFSQVISKGLLLDILATTTAGLIGISIILSAPGILPFGNLYQNVGLIYATTLFFAVAGTPKGTLRLLDRFDILAKYQVTNAAALFIASAILFEMEAELSLYLYVFAAIYIMYNISLLVKMLVIIRRNNYELPNPLRALSDRKSLITFTKTALGTSFLSALTRTRQQVEVILAGYILGQSGAGLYAAINRLVKFVPKLSESIMQVVFPEVAKMIQSKEIKALRKLALRLTGTSFIISVAVLAAISPITTEILLYSLGPSYSAGGDLFLALLASSLLIAGGSHFNPILQSTVGVTPLLHLAIYSYVIFLCLYVPSVLMFGMLGAGISALFSQAFVYLGAGKLSYEQLFRHTKFVGNGQTNNG